MTVVEGDHKAPFSITTTPMYIGGQYFFLWMLYFTLDTYIILLSVKQGDVKYDF